MLIKKIAASAAGGLLAITPIAAQAADTSSYSLDDSPMIAELFSMTYSLSMAANPCISGMQGCVLPLKAAPAPAAEAPVVETPTVEAPAVQEVAAEATDGEGGFGFVPLLLGIAAIAGGVFLLSGNEDDTPASP